MCQEDEYREFKSFYDIRDEMILEMKRRYRAMKFDDKSENSDSRWKRMALYADNRGKTVGYSKAFQGIRL